MTKIKHINLAGVNLVLYSLLVIFTTFIMLQYYLQGFIRHLSGWNINILGTSQPVVIMIFASVLLCIFLVFRKFFSLWNLAALLVLFMFFAFGQWISDYHIDFKYYDLQNNWHFFAYFLFAFVSWSFFKPKRISLSRILLYTWLLGLTISLFDELFQHGMSQRVFDLSDVAKDLWGITTGLLILVSWVGKRSITKFNVRHEKIKDYFSNPVFCIILLMVSSSSFILVNSLLTEKKIRLVCCDYYFFTNRNCVCTYS